MRRSVRAITAALLIAAPLAAQQSPPFMQPVVEFFEGYVGDAVSIQFSVANPPSGGIPGPFVVSGSLPAGLTLNPATGLLSGTITTAGTYQFTISRTYTFTTTTAVVPPVTVSGSYLYYVSVRPSPLTLNQTALPQGQVGVPYTAFVTASGGGSPYLFTLSGGALPPGLTLRPNGALTGTPVQPGEFTFSVTVTDYVSATDTGRFTIIVSPPPLSILTSSLPVGSTGTAYTAQLEASGGLPPYAWSVSGGTLPPGLAIAGATGLLSGTPSSTGTFTFTIQVTDSTQTAATRTFTVRISDPLQITTTALPEGTEGLAYSASIAAAGGFPPYTFSVVQGNLPPGISLSAGGALSGTPGASGEFAVTVQVRDSEGQTASRAFTLTVLLRPSVLTTSLPNGRVADPYSATLQASGRAPFRWSVSSGNLPPGLSLNAESGVLSGTPTLHGTFTFEITVTDGNQPPLSASRSFSVNIELPPLPPLNITQIQDTVTPASQPSFGLQLGQPYPAELNGTAQLEFTPDEGLPPDPAVRFANGSTSVNFTIPAGQAAAVPASGSLFALQTGTTAGTITIRVTLRLGSTVLDPNPFTVRIVRIPPAGPQITRLVILRNPAGFEIQVTGYSNTREVTGAVFRFTPAPGATLSATEVNVPVASAFQSWFSSEPSRQYGGQFLLVVPFTLQGSAGALSSLQVTLTNRAGSGSASANF